MALFYWDRLRSAEKFRPTLETEEVLLRLIMRMKETRLALEMMDKIATSSIRRLQAWTVVDLLRFFADDLSVSGLLIRKHLMCADANATLQIVGVKRCWPMVTEEYGIQPDEGLCLAVIHTATVWGETEMIQAAINVLKSIGVTLREYHLVPLIESHTRSSAWSEVIKTISHVKSEGVEIDIGSLKYLVIALVHGILPKSIRPSENGSEPVQNEGLAGHTDCLKYYLEALQTLVEGEKFQIDITAANIALHACAQSRPVRFEAALELFERFYEYHLEPNLETFNALLLLYLESHRKESGLQLWHNLADHEAISPNGESYELVIKLCLLGDPKPNRENEPDIHKAVKLWEKMMEAQFTPSESLYCLILETMARINYREPMNFAEHTEFLQAVRTDDRIRDQSNGRIKRRSLRDVLHRCKFTL